jgi:hypothetical protein
MRVSYAPPNLRTTGPLTTSNGTPRAGTRPLFWGRWGSVVGTAAGCPPGAGPGGPCTTRPRWTACTRPRRTWPRIICASTAGRSPTTSEKSSSAYGSANDGRWVGRSTGPRGHGSWGWSNAKTAYGSRDGVIPRRRGPKHQKNQKILGKNRQHLLLSAPASLRYVKRKDSRWSDSAGMNNFNLPFFSCYKTRCSIWLEMLLSVLILLSP